MIPDLPWQDIYSSAYSYARDQCDFRFDLFFSFSFVLVLQYFFRFSFTFVSYLSVCKSYTAFAPNIKPADEDVLMICLNTVHRRSRIQRRTAVAPVSAVSYASTFVE